VDTFDYDFQNSAQTTCSNDGWTLTPDWNIGVPTTGGTPDGSLCVLATNPSGVYANSLSNIDAISPSIDLTACQYLGMDLVFDMWNYIEDNGSTNCSYDRAWIEVSGNGIGWTTVDTTCVYNDTFDQQWCLEQMFSAWNMDCTADVSAFVGPGSNFQARFRFRSDGSVQHDGIYLDNVHLERQ